MPSGGMPARHCRPQPHHPVIEPFNPVQADFITSVFRQSGVHPSGSFVGMIQVMLVH